MIVTMMPQAPLYKHSYKKPYDILYELVRYHNKPHLSPDIMEGMKKLFSEEATECLCQFAALKYMIHSTSFDQIDGKSIRTFMKNHITAKESFKQYDIDLNYQLLHLLFYQKEKVTYDNPPRPSAQSNTAFYQFIMQHGKQ